MIKKTQVIALVLIVTALGLSRFQYHKAVTQLEAANDKIITIENSLNEAEDKLIEYQNELEKTNAIIGDLKSDEYELVYMGEYKLTHYCSEMYKHICGTGSGKTATGTKLTPGRSVAVDPTMIPYGTQMYIEGYGFRTAEDCGGAVKNKQIDIAVDTHNEANALGTKSGGVWILIKK